jgi:hypothetical protein
MLRGGGIDGHDRDRNGVSIVLNKSLITASCKTIDVFLRKQGMFFLFTL